MPNPVGVRVGVRGPIRDHSLVRKWLLTCVGLTGFDAGQERFRKIWGSPVVGKKWLRTPKRLRQPALGLGLFEIGAHRPNMARIARSRLARISTHLARSSGSHTNSDTLVGMPFNSV